MFNVLPKSVSETADASAFHTTLIALLAADLLLIGAYVWVLRIYPTWDIPRLWNIGREWSLAESFTYLKWFTSMICMLMLSRLPGRTAFAWIALIFAVLLTDNSLAIHERMGQPVADAIGITAMMAGVDGVNPGDLGEIVMFGLLGTIVCGSLFAAYRHLDAGDRPTVVLFAWLILFLFLVASVFDIGAHIVWDNMTDGYWRHRLRLALIVMEDGGEMVFASVACALAVGTAVRGRGRGPSRDVVKSD